MRKTIGKLFLILMLLVIYAPILILAVYSFTDSGNIGSIHGFPYRIMEHCSQRASFGI